MNWSKDFSTTELTFIILFLAIYSIYWLRLWWISKKLKLSYSSFIIKLVIRSIYFALMIFALMGPNFGISELEARNIGKDIFIGVDLSESMNANDVEPSRLDKVKNELINLVNLFKTDKIGLAVFNTEASLYTPLTYDHDLLKNDILYLRTGLLSKGSTDFNAIFELVFQKFSEMKNYENHSKVFVLITDGESFWNLENQWYNKFKTLGIELFVLGVGTSQGGKIPILNGYKKDKSGQEVVTSLNLVQIADIAKKANGKYFLLNNQNQQISQLQEAIQNVKKSQNTLNQQMVTNNKYVYFLLIALLLVAVDFLLNITILKI
jgi:Ca-activated chloride channel family protein